jgi:hypothetical protein
MVSIAWDLTLFKKWHNCSELLNLSILSLNKSVPLKLWLYKYLRLTVTLSWISLLRLSLLGISLRGITLWWVTLLRISFKLFYFFNEEYYLLVIPKVYSVVADFNDSANSHKDLVRTRITYSLSNFYLDYY